MCGASGRGPERGAAGRILTRIAAALLLLAAFAPVRAAPGEPPLRLAMSGAFRPFSSTDDEGRLVGFDADVAREIATRMGRRPELVQVDWAAIQAALQSGKVDLICGSMAITAERLREMHFSLPYYVSGAQLFLGPDVDSIAGRRLAVTEDSTYARWVADHPSDFPGVEVLAFGSEAEIVAALRADKIDGFVSDRIVGGFYAQRGGAQGIRAHGPLLYREACGIAARRESGDLVRRVNAALFEMVQDGAWSDIYARWVGARPDLSILLESWGEFADRIPRPTAGPETDGDAEPERPGFAERTAQMLPLLARGAWITLRLAALTAVAALLTGVVVAVASVSPSVLLRRAVACCVAVVRGTPLLVQLFLSYYALSTWLNRMAGFELLGAQGAALVALIVNTTAYNAETIRGGILSVDRGQWDAAESLGMTRARILRRIVLPQAFRNSLPSLGNNLVVLIKDTSLVGAITLIELTYAARNIVFQSGQAFLPFALAAVFYLAMISLVTLGVHAAERRLGRFTVREGGRS